MNKKIINLIKECIRENLNEYVNETESTGSGINKFHGKVLDINKKPIPTPVFLGNTRYMGDVGFINGYNGYTQTDDDGLMCAIVHNSLFGRNKVPNYLTDNEGRYIKSTDRSRVSQQNFTVQ